jgi:general secretion pathway protein D
MVLAAIQKLDVVPLQVLIEASILEVSLTDDLRYGVEWFFKNTFDDYKGLGTLDLGVPGIAALSPGFSYTIIDSAANVRIALNALAEESDVNTLASPSLMVLDNHTAKINIGDDVPYPTRSAVSSIDPAAPTVNEIAYRNTGVTLEVTPRVNSSGLVTMEIIQEVSDAEITTTSGIDAPTIKLRQIESTVAINSGETLVLGGLIAEKDDLKESGIPGLYKIPVIGKLFGQTSDLSERRELVVLITPRVVLNSTDARQITDEFRRKLRRLPPITNTPYTTSDSP